MIIFHDNQSWSFGSKVRWAKDNLDGYLNFYSVSGDGNFHTFTLKLYFTHKTFAFTLKTIKLSESATLTFMLPPFVQGEWPFGPWWRPVCGGMMNWDWNLTNHSGLNIVELKNWTSQRIECLKELNIHSKNWRRKNHLHTPDSLCLGDFIQPENCKILNWGWNIFS